MVEGGGYDLERRIHWIAQALVGTAIGGGFGCIGASLGWATRHLEGSLASIALGLGILWTTGALSWKRASARAEAPAGWVGFPQ